MEWEIVSSAKYRLKKGPQLNGYQSSDLVWMYGGINLGGTTLEDTKIIILHL